jgi:outer membrane protein, heavy metal efflux system
MRQSVLRTTWTFALFICLAGFSAAEPMTLEEALRLGPEADADVITARSEGRAAERDAVRVGADPLALRLDRLAADHAVDGARSSLLSSVTRSRIQTAELYVQALEADQAHVLAVLERANAERTLEAQTVRLAAGAVTDLQVERARNDHQAAVRNAEHAESARALAYGALSSRLGVTVSQVDAVPDDVLTRPSLEEAMTRTLRENAQLRAAERSVTLAAARLEAVDNDFSTRAEIEAARDAVASAQVRHAELERSLELGVRSSHSGVLAAQTRYESALASFATSRADLAAQATRFEAGSLSPIAFDQVKLQHANVLAALQSTKHAYLSSIMRLEQTIVGQ